MSGLPDDRPFKDLTEFCDTMFSFNEEHAEMLGKAIGEAMTRFEEFLPKTKALKGTEPIRPKGSDNRRIGETSGSGDRSFRDVEEFLHFLKNPIEIFYEVLAEVTAPGYADKFLSTVKPCVQASSKVAVLVFVLKGKSILLGSSTKEHQKPMFLPPMAPLELGESFGECGARGVKELTGLDVEKLELLTVSNGFCFRNDHTKCDEMHYMFDFLRAVLRNEDQILQPEKFPGWDWHDWDNLPAPLFLPLTKLMRNGFNPFKTQ